MANFHPSDNDLLEFSNGSCNLAVSISISVHLHFCPLCRHKVSELNSVGGHCMTQADKVEVDSDSFAATMQRIKSANTSAPAPTSLETLEAKNTLGIDALTSLPHVVKKLLPDTKHLSWSFITPTLKAIQLQSQTDGFEVQLHKLKKGGSIPEHDHQGKEVTVILEGSFSDDNGAYRVGDYVVMEPGQKHKPTATQDQDCICLSVVEAPVKLTGFWGYFVNPLMNLHNRRKLSKYMV